MSLSILECLLFLKIEAFVRYSVEQVSVSVENSFSVFLREVIPPEGLKEQKKMEGQTNVSFGQMATHCV